MPSGHLPIDVVAVDSGDVLVSDVSGRVTKFRSSGCLLAEWTGVFRGHSGRMAVTVGNDVLVTSAGESCIHRCREADGQRLATFSLQWPERCPVVPDVSAIAINSQDEIVVVASNLRSPHFFDAGGRFLYRSSEADPEMVEDGPDSGPVELPSAVCCDRFDNVLVADFLGNSVHLMSPGGLHLGRLLTKQRHGVACPVFVALDQGGRLYVGQYGGDVAVFRYLSYVKHV